VRDDLAGKRVKCPACGAPQLVPAEEVECDVEIVEEEPPVVEVVEAPPKRDEERPPRAKKKRRRRSSSRDDGPMSRMYMDQARENRRRDEARARAAGGWGTDEDGGRTMFGVHVTAGVLGGAGMLIFGLLCMLLIVIVRAAAEEGVVDPRLFIGAIVCTVLGAIVLIKSLFFG